MTVILIYYVLERQFIKTKSRQMERRVSRQNERIMSVVLMRFRVSCTSSDGNNTHTHISCVFFK